MLALAAEGFDRRQIAAKLGMHPDSVGRHLAKPRVRLEGERLEWARALIAEGCPIVEVARSLGVSRDHVRAATGARGDMAAAVEYREMMKRLEAL